MMGRIDNMHVYGKMLENIGRVGRDIYKYIFFTFFFFFSHLFFFFFFFFFM